MIDAPWVGPAKEVTRLARMRRATPVQEWWNARPVSGGVRAYIDSCEFKTNTLRANLHRRRPLRGSGLGAAAPPGASSQPLTDHATASHIGFFEDKISSRKTERARGIMATGSFAQRCRIERARL